MKQSFLIEKKKAPLRKRNIFFAFLASFFIFGAMFQNDIKTVLADESLWSMVKGGDQGDLLGEVGTKVYGTQDAPKDVRQIVAEVIQVFLSFLALIFIILIILAGYKWMMARGDEGKVTEALNQIQHAVIGLLIILAAYAVTYYVFNVLNNNVIRKF
ncbi:MAG: hypothetical protein WCW25_05075 [Patescibacteria group bacterium]|jgi:hypothetical protein